MLRRFWKVTLIHDNNLYDKVKDKIIAIFSDYFNNQKYHNLMKY